MRALSYPPLQGEGRFACSGAECEAGGVKVSPPEQRASGATFPPPRLTFRFASCEPTLPLQGRVKTIFAGATAQAAPRRNSTAFPAWRNRLQPGFTRARLSLYRLIRADH